VQTCKRRRPEPAAVSKDGVPGIAVVVDVPHAARVLLPVPWIRIPLVRCSYCPVAVVIVIRDGRPQRPSLARWRRSPNSGVVGYDVVVEEGMDCGCDGIGGEESVCILHGELSARNEDKSERGGEEVS